jgi:hypothetical protein
MSISQTLQFPSNCAEDDFQYKSLLLWHSVRLKDGHLNVLEYIPPPLFFLPMAMHFPEPVHLTTSLLQLLKASTAHRKWLITSNIVCREVL